MDELYTPQEIVDILNELCEETLYSFDIKFMDEKEKNARIGAYAAVAVALDLGDLFEDTPAKKAGRI
jgi:hypothetical protein